MLKNYSFDITDNNEIVFVTSYSFVNYWARTINIHVICKYDFDLYNIASPKKLIKEANNPCYVFIITTSKLIEVDNFNNKLEFSLNTMNLDVCFDERDKLIENIIMFEYDFKM